MNKKMDTNFAFAILLLVAAITAMYFWIDNANDQINDIYSYENNMVITHSQNADDMSVDDMEVVSDAGVELDK